MSAHHWPVALLVLVAVVLVAAAAVALVLLLRLLRTRRRLREAGVPMEHKAVFWGAVLYAISPVDLLPDPVYLDDIGVLLLALRSLNAVARRREGPAAPDGPGRADVSR
ncbi:hypothetical protein C9F11_00760 [Streptomyces sp. YIM 121038]|uniref:YkvA family protein n=1 Tax=Streptomyces sp. YIM 121038 TaxID=2136401 RepID=UPI0011622519|nr:YkvA family protein [Streptomyces sp. YIM 121038]QCX73855.1 hypothetical protein C9F11_00760 [Streptomyces sp. YIM 121038]